MVVWMKAGAGSLLLGDSPPRSRGADFDQYARVFDQCPSRDAFKVL